MDNFSNIKLKELSIKLERFQPEDIGKYLDLEQQSSNLDQVKIEAADVMVKIEPREEEISVDELLSDQELEEENTPTPARKVFECPNCPGERTSLNRLRLHICSEHEHQDQNIQCPICLRRVTGGAYENHVIKEHAPQLEEDSYLFSPKLIDDEWKPSASLSCPRPLPLTTIKFNVENPWQELLSPASRQKRTMDTVPVSSILMKTELKPYTYQGETSHTNKAFFNNKKEFVSLQNKVNFICGLDTNSHYKQYLKQLKHLKSRKRLLTKFASILNDRQIEKIKVEIKRSEELLNQSSNYNLQPWETKKTAEIRDHENQILRNLRKKGIIKVGDSGSSSASLLPKRKVVTVNRKTGEISNIVPRNIISLLELQKSKSKISLGKNQIIMNLRKKGVIHAGGESYSLSANPTMTVIDQKDPLSFDDEEEEGEIRGEDENIPSQSLDPLSVIALNIPVEEIIENHVIDIKSEI